MPVREASKRAYRHICESGELDAKCVAVYRWLYFHGPATGNEVVIGVDGESRKVPSQARARLTDLKQRGVVAVVGKATCPVSGAKGVALWDVTSNLPNKKVPRELTLTKAELEEEYRRLTAECARRGRLATLWKKRALEAGWVARVPGDQNSNEVNDGKDG